MKLLIISLNKNLYSVKRLAQEAKPLFSQIDKAHWRNLSFSFTQKGLKVKINHDDLKNYTHLITRIAKKYYLQRYLLVKQAKNLGLKVLNQEIIINMPRYNKFFQYTLLAQAKIPLIPSFQVLNKKSLKEQNLSYPLIVKKITGEQGKQVHKADDYTQAVNLLNKNSFRRCLIQNFAEIGEDIRLYIVGNQVVSAYKRRAIKSFKTVPKGEKEIYTPSPQEKKLALRAASALKGECVGVDLIYYQNKPYILEVNIDAGFKTLEQLSSVNIAKEIISQLIK